MKLPVNIALNRVHVRRSVHIAVVLASVLATIFLLRAHSQREASLYDTTVRNGWQKQALPISRVMSIAAVRARFSITGGGASGDLVWQVTSIDELRASLLALELAAIKLREVKISRRGAGFAVSAEPTQ